MSQACRSPCPANDLESSADTSTGPHPCHEQSASEKFARCNLPDNDVSDPGDISGALQCLMLEENVSLYDPCDEIEEENPEDTVHISQDSKRYLLNTFLESSNICKVRASKKGWGEANANTRRSRAKVASEAIVAALEVISPGDAVPLLQALQQSSLVEKTLGLDESTADKKYLNALVETFRNAMSWDTRRQALSLMADLVPFKVIERHIPGISEYRVKAARRHARVVGRRVPVPSSQSPRMRIDLSKLDHSLSLITSNQVVQDLSFGKKYLKLSNGDVLETPICYTHHDIRENRPVIHPVLQGNGCSAVRPNHHAQNTYCV
ncbi:uncharacterized protein LOC116617388 [Nematostella vectensis]|uniref:uncharacterized protein LOC116617388 n=1 Tax=Nematostella vectensis TaxID=45351 RepID=UPI002076F02C|nr:uncharacterized protein LOC116617388 [Nematostella vectensis]